MEKKEGEKMLKGGGGGGVHQVDDHQSTVSRPGLREKDFHKKSRLPLKDPK